MNDYCEHYHIDCGNSECWLVYDSHNRDDNYRICLRCGCEGNDERCEFKLIGGKEDA